MTSKDFPIFNVGDYVEALGKGKKYKYTPGMKGIVKNLWCLDGWLSFKINRS